MLKLLLTKIFGLLIGNFTPQQKAEFRKTFNTLLTDIAKAAVEGAIAGAVKK